MDLRQLRYFVAVAEEEHFSRAARRSNIVQSALSSSIRSLEEELGAKLFSRTTRQVRLTEAGRVLLKHARIVLDAASTAQAAVANVAGLQRATLRLGASPSLPAFLDLAALLAAFHDRYPGIDVKLSQGNALQLLNGIRDGELDVAIVPLGEPQSGIDALPIMRDPIVLVCATGHPLASRKSIRLSELASLNFVDFEKGWAVRQLADRAFEHAGLSRQTSFEVSDVETMLALVQRGLGVALVPQATARRFSLESIALVEPEIYWELVAAFPAVSEGLDAAPNAFLGLLSEQRHIGPAKRERPISSKMG